MPRLLALVGALTISFSAILVRLADVSPSTAAFYRPLYGLPWLALAWWAVGSAAPRPARRRILALAAGGLMGVAFTVWNYAIAAIGAGLATVLGNTQVAFVGFAAWILFGERPSRAAFAAVPLVFAGAVLTSGLGSGDAYGDAPLRGVAFGLVNALTYSAFLLMFRSVGRGQRVAAGPLFDATVGASLVTLAGGLLTDPGFALAPTWPEHGWLALLGLGPQALGWLCILYALPRLAALETSVILLMQPVLTVLWGWSLLAEAPSPIQLSGVALVLAGVTVVSVRGSVRRPVPPAGARDAHGESSGR